MTLIFHPDATKADVDLQAFASLPVGWKYGEGGPIKAEILKSAKGFVSVLKCQGFRKISAYAGADGSVMVAASHDGYAIEIVVEIDGTFSFSHDLNDDTKVAIEHEKWHVVREALRDCVRAIWGLSDGYTAKTTTATPANLTRTSTKTYMVGCR